MSIYAIFQNTLKNHNSIWQGVIRIVKINNRGEMILNGTTILGESHAILIKLN